jgi:DegV family protein with EDD domain
MALTEKIAIITDSCADVPKELAEKYHMFVLPMQIICPDGEFRDGIDIHAEDIYRRQKTETLHSSTPSGADVEDTLEEIKKQGYTKAIAILLAGGLSSTVNHVRLAAEDMEDLEVAVYDSRQASIGIGVIALQAAEYAANGMGFEELKQKVEQLIQDTKVFFSIDTLEYLQKGGRIGKVTAVAGALLDIKPIMSFDENGVIYAAAKVRTRKAVEKRLLQLVSDCKKEGRPYNLVVADGGAPEERDALEQKLTELFPDARALYRAKIGGALSIHLGSGLLGAGIQYLSE